METQYIHLGLKAATNQLCDLIKLFFVGVPFVNWGQ